MKLISEQTFKEIKASGHGVPRSDKNEIVPFEVSREYTIGYKGSNETLKVRCTQNMPVHLRVL